MKVATFNINNINKRLPNLLDWLRERKPDIVCLQELKCESNKFPEAELLKAGYSAVWEGQKSWNGVAILAKGKTKPVATRRALPGDNNDNQARYIEAAVKGLIVCCVYLPNGNPQPGPKFNYKLEWFRRLAKHASFLQKYHAPIVIAGDFNVAPIDIDIYPTKSWNKDALIQTQPRKAFAELVGKGWTDSLRDVFGDERIYTFWTYWRNRYERDDGLRLDHLLLSKEIATKLTGAGVDRNVRASEGASDHAPAWIRLKQ